MNRRNWLVPVEHAHPHDVTGSDAAAAPRWLAISIRQTSAALRVTRCWTKKCAMSDRIIRLRQDVAMRSLGWTHQFLARPWPEVRAFLDEVRGMHDGGSYLFDICDSVIGSTVEDQLAITTSMHDLVVAPAPIGEPPYDVVIVRAPGSLHPPAAGNVLI